MMPVRFSAPWSMSLKRTTIALVIVLIVVAAGGFLFAPVRIYLIAAPATILGVAALLSVRGYELQAKQLLIHRLAWSTRIPTSDLKAADGRSEVLNEAKPLLACVGLFSYVGFYWHAEWRLMRVFATDPLRAVIVSFANRRIVITPHDPQQFIVRARTMLKTKDFD